MQVVVLWRGVHLAAAVRAFRGMSGAPAAARGLLLSMLHMPFSLARAGSVVASVRHCAAMGALMDMAPEVV